MALLARVADRLYWAARYVERAEDTARIVRAFHELVVDFPGDVMLRWEPLAAIAGSDAVLVANADDVAGETTVMEHLIADRANPGSIVGCVALARENLRTTREVIPREAWQVVNSLSHFVDSTAHEAVWRQGRDRFLARVVDESRRLDGVLDSTMTRANSYRMFRLGRLIERADMTTRVLGVRAAALLQLQSFGVETIGEEVQWMGVLRSLSALQMYQRATRGPIEGEAVVRFLLFDAAFPRSVQGCLEEIRGVLAGLPSAHDVISVLNATEAIVSDCHPITSDGVELDTAMDRLQDAIAALDRAIHDRYLAAW